ncbi:MAG: CDP-2,3-bis-(O-geranylgeranyl)-sn-glycerol synthase [Candidatus Thermoplasmatota archaeon]|jgi:CDP-2,3-bis-(O-geranylgeranyl)-sn-glycerol synthase|nr:CDP-2,3-bis-(O-geranylgeranyl)-sn-glycerol synthase [Candidatus Thermoplasmatota archaeon]
MGYEIIIQALWLVLPAYIANASALLVGGGTPIDFGKFWKDGKRILGDGKTWRGLITGGFVGMTSGFGLSVVAKYAAASDFAFLGINDFTGFPFMIPIIMSICFGALIGDIVESFFKRRIGKNRGEDWIPFDQLDFIFGALFFSFVTASVLKITGLTDNNWFFESFSIWHILFLVFITPFFHLFANLVNKKLIYKKTCE